MYIYIYKLYACIHTWLSIYLDIISNCIYIYIHYYHHTSTHWKWIHRHTPTSIISRYHFSWLNHWLHLYAAEIFVCFFWFFLGAWLGKSRSPPINCWLIMAKCWFFTCWKLNCWSYFSTWHMNICVYIYLHIFINNLHAVGHIFHG